VVAWNKTERIWECGCHGSRFDAFGRVLNGPAHEDLAPIEAPAMVKAPRKRALEPV
jgi:Rieske Fe-S protein